MVGGGVSTLKLGGGGGGGVGCVNIKLVGGVVVGEGWSVNIELVGGGGSGGGVCQHQTCRGWWWW